MTTLTRREIFIDAAALGAGFILEACAPSPSPTPDNEPSAATPSSLPTAAVAAHLTPPPVATGVPTLVDATMTGERQRLKAGDVLTATEADRPRGLSVYRLSNRPCTLVACTNQPETLPPLQLRLQTLPSVQLGALAVAVPWGFPLEAAGPAVFDVFNVARVGSVVALARLGVGTSVTFSTLSFSLMGGLNDLAEGAWSYGFVADPDGSVYQVWVDRTNPQQPFSLARVNPQAVGHVTSDTLQGDIEAYHFPKSPCNGNDQYPFWLWDMMASDAIMNAIMELQLVQAAPFAPVFTDALSRKLAAVMNLHNSGCWRLNYGGKVYDTPEIIRARLKAPRSFNPQTEIEDAIGQARLFERQTPGYENVRTPLKPNPQLYDQLRAQVTRLYGGNRFITVQMDEFLRSILTKEILQQAVSVDSRTMGAIIKALISSQIR